ncbi:hypothetical protein KIPE111705_24305 [Kibdelosporangium persicum]|uniref:Uncharacterized protein n=1 Tax=Kibdelosporangium persicum TaxID=2698649 RepID=A0ABX2FEI9_9PSEU|nr:hypothetical protein [Kibdelosporangium persicum]NRN69317.1 hypothetical protein [Kibdelosporangium persicum]
MVEFFKAFDELREIPDYVLDARLRMAERGFETVPPVPGLLALLGEIDLAELARTRPGLIKRAKFLMAERGEFDAVSWP